MVLKKGDIVQLIEQRRRIERYCEGDSNPIGVNGVVLYIEGNPTFSLPIRVSWPKGRTNAYKSKDLELISSSFICCLWF